MGLHAPGSTEVAMTKMMGSALRPTANGGQSGVPRKSGTEQNGLEKRRNTATARTFLRGQKSGGASGGRPSGMPTSSK